jgi:hypothetical protein
MREVLTPRFRRYLCARCPKVLPASVSDHRSCIADIPTFDAGSQLLLAYISILAFLCNNLLYRFPASFVFHLPKLTVFGLLEN